MSMASPQVHRPRTIKKLEKPKTLKINQRIEFETSSRSPQVDDIVSSLDKVTMILNNGFYDQNIQSNIITMSNHLKLFSDDLEKYYKDQLDRAFVAIRNGSQDDRLDLNSRIHLLELIELRAKQWRLTEHTNAYYAQKKSDLSDNEENIQNPSINLMASPSLETSNATTPVLGHNDILKSSGRFLKPTRIPGKNYKDEVVIRNSDSGKVMGIKGRRVHMIEELSETIISFQRVNPGQKERLVQITGNSEEKISYAKNLIKDTIQRNASPMRMEHLGRETGIGGSSSSLSSSTSEESARLQQVQNNSMNSGLINSNLTNDLNEYKYTVTVGNDSLKITGTNIELVQKAKLVLDDYFTEEPVEYFNYEEDNEFVSSNSTNLLHTPVSAGQTINSIKKANIPFENENGKSPISPEKDSKKNEPLRELSYDFLMQCSKGPYAKRPPADWENIQKEFPNIIQKVYYPENENLIINSTNLNAFSNNDSAELIVKDKCSKNPKQILLKYLI